jgi:hypothetical protein
MDVEKAIEHSSGAAWRQSLKSTVQQLLQPLECAVRVLGGAALLIDGTSHRFWRWSLKASLHAYFHPAILRFRKHGYRSEASQA